MTRRKYILLKLISCCWHSFNKTPYKNRSIDQLSFTENKNGSLSEREWLMK